MTTRGYSIEDDDLQRVVKVLSEASLLRMSEGQGIEGRLLQSLAVDLDLQQHAQQVEADENAPISAVRDADGAW